VPKERGYLDVTEEAGRAFFARGIAGPVAGPVVMLNLLRFRATADYAATPGLAPAEPITGEAAYRQASVASFRAFASDKDDLAGIGHRTAALADSRLLPLAEAPA